jgi:hypothetical protein
MQLNFIFLIILIYDANLAVNWRELDTSVAKKSEPIATNARHARSTLELRP